MNGSPGRNRLFWAAFLAVILLVAGGLSYLASSSPDGLYSAALRGCEVVEAGDTETLTGDCIARGATEHALAGSPLADYSLAGAQNSVGAAGVIGAFVTLAAAGALFRLIATAGPRSARGDIET